jgi:hypothetical protein
LSHSAYMCALVVYSVQTVLSPVGQEPVPGQSRVYLSVIYIFSGIYYKNPLSPMCSWCHTLLNAEIALPLTII